MYNTPGDQDDRIGLGPGEGEPARRGFDIDQAPFDDGVVKVGDDETPIGSRLTVISQ